MREISAEKIIEACYEMKERGWRIENLCWFDAEYREMCPLAAFVLRNFPKEIVELNVVIKDWIKKVTSGHIGSAIFEFLNREFDSLSVRVFTTTIDTDRTFGNDSFEEQIKSAFEKAFVEKIFFEY